MKVLLISANMVHSPHPVYPLGVDYVAGAIADRHEVRVLDVNRTGGGPELGAAIAAFAPAVTGISLRNVDNTDGSNPAEFIDKYRVLVGEVRRHTSGPVVLGGSGFTIFPREIMAALDADYGVIGEGERFGSLLDALEAGEDPGSLPGVIRRGDDPAIPGPWEGPVRRLFDPAGEHTGFYLNRGGILNLQSKRGCAFRCIYCTYPRIDGHTLRLAPPREIALTARRLADAGARYFFITDSAFNCDYEHSATVAREFIREGITVPWGAFFAPTPPPEGYYRLMREAGCSHVEFGTESLSDPVLRAYRKPFDTAGVFAAHEHALDAGLHAAHYLLLGGPGEDPGTIAETLDNAERLRRTVLFFFCGMRIYPHTELYEIARAEGMITEAQSLLEPVFYQSPAVTTGEIIETVTRRKGARANWIIGSGGDQFARRLSRLYRKGAIGPLWEHLIQ